MKCPRCGYTESDESEFCSRCGKLLKAPKSDDGGRVLRQVEEEEDETKAKARRAQKLRNAGIAAGAAVVVLAGAFAGYKIAQGPPANIIGNWSSSSYGGLLAMLTPGTRLQIQGEKGGHLTGTLTFSTTTEPIVQSSVSGHHVSFTAKSSTASTYYTFTGTVSADGNTIDGVIVAHNTSANPPTAQASQLSLHKV